MCPRLSRNANDDAIGLPLLTSAGDYTLDEMLSHMMGGGGHVAGHVAENGHSSGASRKRKEVSTPLQLQDLANASCLWEQEEEEEEEERADDVTLDEFIAQFWGQGSQRNPGGAGESEEAPAKRAKYTPPTEGRRIAPPASALSAPAPTRQLSVGPSTGTVGVASPLAWAGTSSFLSAHSVAAPALLPSSDASHHGTMTRQLSMGPTTGAAEAAPIASEAAPIASSTMEPAGLGASNGSSTSQTSPSPVASKFICGTQTKRSWGRTLQEEGRVTAPAVYYKEEANRPVGLSQKQGLVEGPGYQAPHYFGRPQFGGFPCGLRSDTWSLALLQQRALLANVSLQRSMLHETPGVTPGVCSGVCKQKTHLPSSEKRAWGEILESPNSRLGTSVQLSREVQHPWTAAEALIALTAGRGSKRGPTCRYGSDVFGMF